MRAAAVAALVLGGLIVTWWAAGDRIEDAWAGMTAPLAPHLHFGIHRPGAGAIDPLPFICDAPCGSRPGRREAAASGGGTAYAR
mgnify:CR=1 FL=1